MTTIEKNSNAGGQKNAGRHVKIKPKQREEIEFLSGLYGLQPTWGEINDYLLHTVHGRPTVHGNIHTNPLFQSKRTFDLTVKMWREDLSNGLVGYRELIDEFNSPFVDRLVNSIMKVIVFQRRYNSSEGQPIISGSSRIEYVRHTSIGV